MKKQSEKCETNANDNKHYIYVGEIQITVHLLSRARTTEVVKEKKREKLTKIIQFSKGNTIFIYLFIFFYGCSKYF